MASIDLALSEEQRALRAGVLEICKRYPGEYWRDLDTRREYPEKFVSELTEAGYLAALIPQEYGGAGLGIREGGLILETINYSGGNAGACHAQMYIMGTVLRHGSAAQKREYLPKIATGALRLQAFGVTEPNSGSDTTKLQTTAIRKGDRYIVNGQKIFISRVLQSDLMLLLARTTPVDQVKRRTDGLSVFLIDIRNLKGFEVRAAPHDDEPLDERALLRQRRDPGREPDRRGGQGLQLHPGRDERRAHPGRLRLAGRRALVHRQGGRVLEPARHLRPADRRQPGRAVRDRPLAHLDRRGAAHARQGGGALRRRQPCGGEANMAKYLGAEAAWEAGNACIDCHGGYGYAEEYDVERKFRECRLYENERRSTTTSSSPAFGEHVLGMPRSY